MLYGKPKMVYPVDKDKLPLTTSLRSRLRSPLSREAVLRPTLGHLLPDLAHVWSLAQSFHPSIILRIRTQLLELAKFAHETFADHGPGDESQVSIRTLVTDQPAGAVASKACIKDTRDTNNFCDVTIDGGWDLLGMEPGEPGRLAEIWTLSCEQA